MKCRNKSYAQYGLKIVENYTFYGTCVTIYRSSVGSKRKYFSDSYNVVSICSLV